MVEPRLDGGEDRRDAGAERDSGSMTEEDASTPRDAGSDAGQMPTMDSGPPEGCAGGPLELPIPDCRPTPVPNTGDPYADCVARINQLRFECQCLPPLGRWTGGESCADSHAEYDSTRPAHSGFRDGICANGGSAQNECPGWGSVPMTIDRCLQVMWDEGPGEPFSEHGHYINMTNTRFSEVACGFFTTASGQVWAIQNFR
jgi:hypothetical protein